MKKYAIFCIVSSLIILFSASSCNKAEIEVAEIITTEITTTEITTAETTTVEITASEITTAETTTAETTTAESTTAETTTAEITTPESTTAETTTAETTTAETTTVEITTSEITTAETTTAEVTTAEIIEIELSDYQQEVLDLVNKCRTDAGLEPLDSNYAALNETAQLRAEELEEYFSHTRPDGNSCFTAFDECGVAEKTRAENIAWGDGANKTPEEVVQNWIDSSGHYKNIMNPDNKHLGVGFHKYESLVGNDACYAWTQEFCN